MVTARERLKEAGEKHGWAADPDYFGGLMLKRGPQQVFTEFASAGGRRSRGGITYASYEGPNASGGNLGSGNRIFRRITGRDKLGQVLKIIEEKP